VIATALSPRSTAAPIASAGVSRPSEDVVSRLEMVEGEVVGDEASGVELVAHEEAQQGRDRGGVDPAGGDGDVADPERLQMQRRGMTMDADVGNMAAWPHKLRAELERLGHTDGFDHDVGTKAMCELVHSGDGVVAAVVDRHIGSELACPLEP